MDNKKIEDIYFLRIGKIRYLMSKNYKKDCCQICGEKKETTAHHIVPKRLCCVCPLLAEVRVRVCEECDSNFHPENKFIKESDIVKRQSKVITRYNKKIKEQDSKIRAMEKKMQREVGKSDI